MKRFYVFPTVFHISDSVFFISCAITVNFIDEKMNANVYDSHFTSTEMSLVKVNNIRENADFPIMYIFAIQITCLILRMAHLLQFNEKIGPVIKIVGKMIKDFFNFSMLYFLLVMMFLPTVLADDDYAPVDTEITAEERAQFDEILTPVMKIYNFIKYIATAVAVVFIAIAGISFMTSGNDPRKRDQAKTIATYVVIGLVVIWAAPLIVGILL